MRQRLPRLLKNGNRLLPAYRRELIEEDLKGITLFNVIEQILDWHARTGEHRRAALDLRINGHNNALVHVATPWLLSAIVYRRDRTSESFFNDSNRIAIQSAIL